ncbi:MAG: mycoredoxin [Corynebacterium sp.]|nr:mycoredoxin [Corynebacterium sp.]
MTNTIPTPATTHHVTVFYATWCPYCTNLRTKLSNTDIDYDEVDVEQAGMDDVNEWIKSVNNGNRIVPTVLYSDGSHATNPTPKDVVAKFAELTNA